MSEVLPVRRWGSDVIHLVDNPPTYPAQAFGQPCTAVLMPVVAMCGAVLRGKGVVMKDSEPAGDEFTLFRTHCRHCAHVRKLLS